MRCAAAQRLAACPKFDAWSPVLLSWPTATRGIVLPAAAAIDARRAACCRAVDLVRARCRAATRVRRTAPRMRQCSRCAPYDCTGMPKTALKLLRGTRALACCKTLARIGRSVVDTAALLCGLWLPVFAGSSISIASHGLTPWQPYTKPHAPGTSRSSGVYLNPGSRQIHSIMNMLFM